MITLRDVFRILDSECKIELINNDTERVLMRGIRGMIDNACPEADWEVIHILPDSTTKIWVKRTHIDIEEDF